VIVEIYTILHTLAGSSLL